MDDEPLTARILVNLIILSDQHNPLAARPHGSPMSSPPATIRFTGPIREPQVTRLMATVDDAVAGGAGTVRLLLSSQGGSVFWGVTAYNHLKGVPARVVTHNLGSVNSVAVALYCAGDERLVTPHGRFLLHPLTAPFKPSSLERGQLAERLAGMDEDERVVSSIIAEATGSRPADIVTAMHERSFWHADEAVARGLAHRIEARLHDGGDVVQIG